jgi:hypothetical protein
MFLSLSADALAAHALQRRHCKHGQRETAMSASLRRVADSDRARLRSSRGCKQGDRLHLLGSQFCADSGHDGIVRAQPCLEKAELFDEVFRMLSGETRDCCVSSSSRAVAGVASRNAALGDAAFVDLLSERQSSPWS